MVIGLMNFIGWIRQLGTIKNRIMKTYTLKRGDTWDPILQFYSNKQKTTAFDATGYSGKCYIKEELDEDRPHVVEVDVVWTDQAGGIGTVSIDYADSLKLRIHEYVYEIKLFTAANATRKTVDQGYLDVVEVLEKD